MYCILYESVARCVIWLWIKVWQYVVSYDREWYRKVNYGIKLRYIMVWHLYLHCGRLLYILSGKCWWGIVGLYMKLSYGQLFNWKLVYCNILWWGWNILWYIIMWYGMRSFCMLFYMIVLNGLVDNVWYIMVCCNTLWWGTANDFILWHDII